MGDRDCVGVFPRVVFILRNACFGYPPINDSIRSRFLALIVLTSSVLVSSTALRVLCCSFVMLDLQDEGSSKQTCMACVSRFPQNPVLNHDPSFLIPIN